MRASRMAQKMQITGQQRAAAPAVPAAQFPEAYGTHGRPTCVNAVANEAFSSICVQQEHAAPRVRGRGRL